MLNTTEYKEVRLSKDLILSHVSEADIFYRYLGIKPKLRVKFRNPFRDDKVPTCGFYFTPNNTLKFKDFTGWCNWTCFDAVMYVEKLTFSDTLIRVAHDFGIISGNYVQPREQKISMPVIEAPKDEFSSKLQITSKEFTTLEYEIWRRYGIRPETLALYRVKSVSHVWLNGRPIKQSTKTNPIFAYCFDEGTYKVYSPLSEDFKWISSCKSHHYQGYDQLDWVGDLLIITKSMKDVMVLREMGYNAIAPHSEHCNIPHEFMNTLRKRFNNIVVFFDNDDAGIRGSKAICEEHQLKSIIIPQEESHKDISDYVKSNNLQKGKILMDKILS